MNLIFLIPSTTELMSRSLKTLWIIYLFPFFSSTHLEGFWTKAGPLNSITNWLFYLLHLQQNIVFLRWKPSSSCKSHQVKVATYKLVASVDSKWVLSTAAVCLSTIIYLKVHGYKLLCHDGYHSLLSQTGWRLDFSKEQPSSPVRKVSIIQVHTGGGNP